MRLVLKTHGTMRCDVLNFEMHWAMRCDGSSKTGGPMRCDGNCQSRTHGTIRWDLVAFMDPCEYQRDPTRILVIPLAPAQKLCISESTVRWHAIFYTGRYDTIRFRGANHTGRCDAIDFFKRHDAMRCDAVRWALEIRRHGAMQCDG